jgi:hypothetical protein
MSRRTDGGPADPQPMRHVPTADYGGAAEMTEVQRGAPMAGTPRVPRFDAPTEKPDEPITAGAPFGPGPGPMPGMEPEPAAPQDAVAVLLRAAYAAHPSPQLGTLMDYLESQGR